MIKFKIDSFFRYESTWYIYHGNLISSKKKKTNLLHVLHFSTNSNKKYALVKEEICKPRVGD